MVSKQTEQEILNNCICYREQTTLFCTKCVTFSFGRIERECNKHKKVKFLMDLTICPNCKVSQKFLREIKMDQLNARALNSMKL